MHVSLYFATHFVNLARLSSHAFHDRFLPSTGSDLSTLTFRLEEEKFLIYNYKQDFLGKHGIDWLFEEAYLFKWFYLILIRDKLIKF